MQKPQIRRTTKGPTRFSGSLKNSLETKVVGVFSLTFPEKSKLFKTSVSKYVEPYALVSLSSVGKKPTRLVSSFNKTLYTTCQQRVLDFKRWKSNDINISL